MAHDFVIGSLTRVAPYEDDPSQFTQCRDTVDLARQHLRGGLCDLSGLIRDTLDQVRARGTPLTRALFLVRLFPELPCDARGQLAVALSTTLHADELMGIARAGLLGLDDGCALVEPHLQSAVRRLLATPLAARPRPSVHRGTLWCAEELTPSEVARCAAKREREKLDADTRVIFVASAVDPAVSVEEATDLLAAEARLSDDAELAHFAVLAANGGLQVVGEATLRPPPSLMQRTLAMLAAAVQKKHDTTEHLFARSVPLDASSLTDAPRLECSGRSASVPTSSLLRAAHP